MGNFGGTQQGCGRTSWFSCAVVTLKGCKLSFESLDGHTMHRSILELFHRKTTRSPENAEGDFANGHEIDEDDDKGPDNYTNCFDDELKETPDIDFGLMKKCKGSNCGIKSWIQMDPRLFCFLYDEQQNKCYCKVCVDNSITDTEWTSGRSQPQGGWKKDYLLRHLASREHLQALSVPLNAANWEKALFTDALNSDSKEDVVHLLRNVLWLIKEQLPISKAKSLHRLIESHGVSLGRRHRSKNYSWQFVAALNEPVEAENLIALKQARVHSLVVDESSDITTEKHLMMYTKFLAKKFYVEHQICLQSMAMITTNGSPIMMGSKGGLHVKLKVDIPWLLGQHFVVHSEALAMKDSYNEITLFQEIDGCFKAIYAYISRSTVKHSGLEEVLHVLETNAIKLAKACHLKWINRGRAIQAICKSYQTLIIYFSDMSYSDHDITAESILLKLQQPRILLAIFFLRDLLHHLDNLSLFFQERFVNPVRVPERVQATINLLECKYLGNNILWESSFLLGIQLLESGALSRPPMTRKPHGPILHKTAAKATDEIALSVKTLVKNIVDSLKERFPDNAIIRAFRILDPDRIPSDPEKLAQYGNSEAAALQSHFSDLLSNDGKDLVAEWDQMKYLIASRKGESLDEVCIDLAHSDMWRKEYPNFSILSEVCVVMSASTAEPDTGFTSVNLIKNKYRNRLTSDQLDQLLRLCLEKPEDRQDYLDAAYAAWLQAEQWRLLLKEWRRGEESKTESDSTESDADPLSDSE
ncbi:zinc finger protein 862-like isoform X2 [Chiloscyllium punctatum]|uniref:zinc finger protein 862-like isoform X2 n=1 Tax=Chiloscyllium punctatum TaxID=137246 RepID=UPI003B638EDA